MTEEITLTSRISLRFAGRSLTDFLSHRFKYHSREEWERLIGEGRAMVNGKPSMPGYLLNSGDVVAYADIRSEPPVDVNVQIIHEEEAFLVANKPGNLPSHSGGMYIRNTLISLLRERMAGKGCRGILHLAHRLDRETSGIIVAANTEIAHRSLVQQFEAGTVEKEYVAVVHGVINTDSFEVKGFLVPDPDSCISIRKKVVPDECAGAKYSATAFDVLERFSSSTLVRCRPVTGRTNQIRIHLAHSGHPLVGDKLYGRTDDEFLAYVRNIRAGRYDLLPWLEAARHLLHASLLIINHPLSGERLAFHAPVPEDMKSFICTNRS